MFYVISEEDVARIKRVMKRLYSEKRMDGDTMRDNAQALDYALDQMFEYLEHT